LNNTVSLVLSTSLQSVMRAMKALKNSPIPIKPKQFRTNDAVG
jgi:hypothetical protein